jgi:hypothetical protein
VIQKKEKNMRPLSVYPRIVSIYFLISAGLGLLQNAGAEQPLPKDIYIKDLPIGMRFKLLRVLEYSTTNPASAFYFLNLGGPGPYLMGMKTPEDVGLALLNQYRVESESPFPDKLCFVRTKELRTNPSSATGRAEAGETFYLADKKIIRRERRVVFSVATKYDRIGAYQDVITTPLYHYMAEIMLTDQPPGEKRAERSLKLVCFFGETDGRDPNFNENYTLGQALEPLNIFEVRAAIPSPSSPKERWEEAEVKETKLQLSQLKARAAHWQESLKGVRVYEGIIQLYFSGMFDHHDFFLITSEGTIQGSMNNSSVIPENGEPTFRPYQAEEIERFDTIIRDARLYEKKVQLWLSKDGRLSGIRTDDDSYFLRPLKEKESASN